MIDWSFIRLLHFLVINSCDNYKTIISNADIQTKEAILFVTVCSLYCLSTVSCMQNYAAYDMFWVLHFYAELLRMLTNNCLKFLKIVCCCYCHSSSAPAHRHLMTDTRCVKCCIIIIIIIDDFHQSTFLFQHLSSNLKLS